MKDRKDIDKKYTWDLEKIYSSIEEFEQDYKLVKDMIEDFSGYEKKMLDSSKEFYEATELTVNIDRKIEKLYDYANLSFDLDTADNGKQELCERVSNLYSLYKSKGYFYYLNVLKCGYDGLEKFYEEEPRLKEYDISFRDMLRFKEHTLSDAEEKLMANLSKAIGNCQSTYELFTDADMSFDDIEDEKGKKVPLTNSNYSVYMESKKRQVREDAFKTLYSEYKKYANTIGSLLMTNMKELSTFAKINKYNSAIEDSLYADAVDVKVYENLIASVHDGIGYLHEYYDLKKKVLGLDELHLYDVYVPIVSEYNKKYDYETAKKTILKVLKVFGKEYTDKVKDILDNRIIDVYPTKNKRTGGYSGGCYDTEPYILLNYQDKYGDMSTLIHEMGHSMHSYYSRTYNSYQNSSYKIFVAEVASTVNELLLSKYMLEHSKSKEEKLFILNNLMELYRATIYRQTMFAEFEKIISEMTDKEEVLTAEKLSNIYYDLNKFYFGKGTYVDDEIRYEWERIPHFYYDFYVYKYATGLSASTVIVNDILSGKEKAVDNYIEFLKCGSKLLPIDSLKLAGVDLTDKKVVKMATEEFKKILDMYKELIN